MAVLSTVVFSVGYADFHVLEDACYLGAISLAHHPLACRDILLDLDGIIKMGQSEFPIGLPSRRSAARLDNCVDCAPSYSEAMYIVALPSTNMRLIQKYNKDEGTVGVDNLKRWPIGSTAVSFLSTTGATALMELLMKASYLEDMLNSP